MATKKMTAKEIEALQKKNGGQAKMTASQIEKYREQVQSSKYEITAPDGTKLGKVDYDTYNAIRYGRFDYKPKNSADAKVISEYANGLYFPVVGQDGTDYGKVTYSGYQAIVNNSLDKYKPINDTEKTAIDGYKSYVGNLMVDFKLSDGTNVGKISKNGLDAISNDKIHTYKPKNDEEKKTIEKFKDVSNYVHPNDRVTGDSLGAHAKHTGDQAKWSLESVWNGIKSTFQMYFDANYMNDVYHNPAYAIGEGTGALPEGTAEAWRNIGEERREAILASVQSAYEELNKESALIDNKYPDLNETGRKWGKYIGGTAQLVPMVAASAINPYLGSAVLGAQVYGNSMGEALSEGADAGEAAVYGALEASKEIIIERLVGGLPFMKGIGDDIAKSIANKVTSKLFSNATKNAFTKFASATTKYGISTALDGAGEGLEEVIATYTSPYIKRAVYDKDAPLASEEELREAFMGGVVASVLSGTANSAVKGVVTSKQLKKNISQFNDLIDAIPETIRPAKLSENATVDEYNSAVAKFVAGVDVSQLSAEKTANSAMVKYLEAEIEKVKQSDVDDAQKQKQIDSYESEIKVLTDDTKSIELSIKELSDIKNGKASDKTIAKYIGQHSYTELSLPENVKMAADKVTNRTTGYYKYGADVNKISALNTKFLASKGSGINSDFVRGYIDTFAEMIKANNSPIYKALSSDGVDIPKALYEYITTGKIPEGITNTKAFLSAAQMMKNILTESITASVTAHKAIYGENATLDAQLEAIKNGDFSFLTQNEYNHLYDETKVSKEFLVSVNEEIENAIINIRKGDLDSVPDVIGVTELSPETIKKISDFVGFDISGYKCRIEKDALVHIEKRHGINGEHDHSLSDPKDTARMGYAINHIDNIEWVTDEKGNVVRSKKYNNKDNTSCPVMSLSSRIDGTYCVSQAVPDTKRKTIWVTSARIEKADGGSQVPNGRESTPQPTPKAPLVSSSADNNIPQNEQIVNNNGMQNNEKNASEIVTLKQTDNIYSVFEDAKLIYEGADCITDKKVVIPKSTEAIDEISAVSDALIEVADEYKLARVYDKSNSVLIEGDPKVADDGYIFKIDGKFYACRQKDLDAFNNGKRTIKANTNEKTMWSVHNESGELVAVFMPLKTASITEDMYNSFPYASEVIAKENSTDETSTKELKSQAENDTIEENDIDSIDYSLEDTLPEFEQLIDNEVLHSVSVTKVKMRQFPSRKESSGSDTNQYCTQWSYREDVFVGDQTIVFHNGRCYVIEKYDDIEFKYQIVGRIRYADYTALREEILTDVRNNNESTIKGMVDIYNKRNRQGNWTEGRGQGSNSDSVEYRREDRQILQMDTNQDSGREIRGNSSGSDAHNSADRQTGGRVDNSFSIESEADYVEGNNILNGSEQRNVGKRPGEQTGRVGKSSRRGNEKTIQERQRFLGGLKADQKEEKILTDSAGRKNKFTVVKKTAWNEHMKSLAARYEGQGVTVEYIDGGISIAFVGGKHLARGMRVGDTIYVSYNNRRVSPEQIAEHEFIHNKYATDEVQEAKKQILERMPEEEYNKAIEKIEEAYSGIVNKTALEEELICNILSGMYENTAEYADIANEYWSKAESDILGYDVAQYAESIDAGGELN